MINELSRRIWERPEFQAEYHQLLRDNLGHSINVKSTPAILLQRDSLRRLLQSATHFAASTDPILREAAYRIATGSWMLFGDEYDNIREIAHLILGRLGNFPAINFLFSGSDTETRGQKLPNGLWLEVKALQVSNAVKIGEGFEVTLTDFQKRLWESLRSGRSVAVTAPTSTGKSYTLQRYLLSTLFRERGWGLYLVPTRALINQVSAALSNVFNNFGNAEFAVCTIPIPPSELGQTTGVYVLTQERLQILLEENIPINFGLAIVDEAQMVAEGARGVILQTVIERLKLNIPSIQFLFGAPQTANPDIFGQLFDLDSFEHIKETESPVAQNLIFIDTDPIRTKQIKISARIGNNKANLGRILLDTALYDADQSLSYISWIFGRNQKSLIYAGGQAHCEKLAHHIYQLIIENEASAPTPPDPLLADFSEFLKEHIHPKFLLAETVLYGVAFHYGNMPSIVRRTIEEYFDEGRLSFLACTSTLLHGVNLPAKNLFLLDPTKGRDWEAGKVVPISSLEFWNLAGRAGRLGRDFEGNIFLVDHEKWKSKPLAGEREQEIKPTVNNVVSENTDEFIAFVKDRKRESGLAQAIENTFVKLFNDYRNGHLEKTLNKIFGDKVTEKRRMIEDAISEVTNLVNVPHAITERNISISVFRQQEMLDYLVNKIERDGPERFIPIHPLRPWKEALESLLRLFKRIHSHFEVRPGRDKSHYFFAPLALRWMRGEPLARLIDEAYKYKLKKHKRVKIATVIREVLARVEQDLRFRYVKYTSAYNDLLFEALVRTKNESLVENIPAIPLFLELGASSKTMVNMVGLGVSRTSAGILTEFATNKEMSRPEVERWIQKQDWEALGISAVVLREIKRNVL